MRPLLLSFFLLMPCLLQAQLPYVITFETPVLPKADTFYSDYTAPGTDVGFNQGDIHFPLVFDTSFGFTFWSSGFTYSNRKDSVSSGPANQYSAKAGAGYGGSSQYVVAYGEKNRIYAPLPFPAPGIYLTNNTYAYNSMRDGDGFAKKFGGITGNDPDWFLLVIHGYLNGIRKPDSVTFYLADFRTANNSQDYIVKDWTYLSLKSLGQTDSLEFLLRSSDTSGGYMNTPAYFCMDQMMFVPQGIASLPFESMAGIYPNPASDQLTLLVKDPSCRQATVYDASGKIMTRLSLNENKNYIPMAGWPSGNYFIQLEAAKGIASTRFIKL